MSEYELEAEGTARCTVYRSEKHEGMYLYVAATTDLESLPEALTKRFGEAVQVMQLKLTAQRKLARVDVVNVMAALTEQGFYLQLPPVPGTEAKPS